MLEDGNSYGLILPVNAEELTHIAEPELLNERFGPASKVMKAREVAHKSAFHRDPLLGVSREVRPPRFPEASEVKAHLVELQPSLPE
jgi:hypothetical protein